MKEHSIIWWYFVLNAITLNDFVDYERLWTACGPVTKSKERIQESKETGDSKYFYRNELDRTCFQHDMAYGDFKDLGKRAASDKLLRDKTFNIAKNPRYDGYERGLASMVYKCFDKKPAALANKSAKGRGVATLETKQLTEEFYKPIIKNFEKRKVHSSFKDNIWDTDLADLKLCKFNKVIRYVWVVL